MAARKKKFVGAPVVKQTTYEVVNEGQAGFLTHVTSNIKGGVNTKLGACTAIVSNRNRAGKTAVLDSIRLALTGQHPIGPHYADLMGLTADGAPPFAYVLGEDGTAIASSSVPNGKKSMSHEDRLPISDAQRAAMLPMSSVRDLLTLGTAKAREEVFRRFGGGQDAIPVPVELDDEQLALWEEITNATKRSDPSEWLAAAGEEVRKRKRSNSAEMKSLEEEKSRLAEQISDEGDPTDELADLETRITKAEKSVTLANLLKSKDEAKQQLNDEIEAFANRPAPLTAEEFAARPEKAQRAVGIEVSRKELTDFNQQHAANLSRLGSAQRILTLRKHLAGGCLVCESPEPSADRQHELVTIMEGMIAALESDLRPGQLQAAAMEKAHKQLVQDDARLTAQEEEAWRSATVAYQNAQNRLKALGEHYKRLVASLEDAGVEESIDAAALHKMRERFSKLSDVKRAMTRMAGIKAMLRNRDSMQDDIKEVESAIGDSLNKLLERIKAKAEAAVNKWMPEGFRVALQLADSEGKAICRWEVIGNDERPHPRNCASGAEWSALTVALACAWVEDSPYKFVMLDDADIGGFSANNVENVLHTLQQAVERKELTQVFVAWSRPEEIPSNGWTVVSP